MYLHVHVYTYMYSYSTVILVHSTLVHSTLVHSTLVHSTLVHSTVSVFDCKTCPRKGLLCVITYSLHKHLTLCVCVCVCRFCLQETTCEQNDFYPKQCFMKVNGHSCPIPVSLHPTLPPPPPLTPLTPPSPLPPPLHPHCCMYMYNYYSVWSECLLPCDSTTLT